MNLNANPRYIVPVVYPLATRKRVGNESKNEEDFPFILVECLDCLCLQKLGDGLNLPCLLSLLLVTHAPEDWFPILAGDISTGLDMHGRSRRQIRWHPYYLGRGASRGPCTSFELPWWEKVLLSCIYKNISIFILFFILNEGPQRKGMRCRFATVFTMRLTSARRKVTLRFVHGHFVSVILSPVILSQVIVSQSFCPLVILCPFISSLFGPRPSS
jgi:hypothetical protein